ncbi:hypothetical protein Tco_1250989 [Tanacetum coccineum]
MRPIYSAKLKLPDPLALLSNLSILATQFFNHLSFICDRLIKKWTPEDCQHVALLERRLMNPLIKTDLSLPSCKRDLELTNAPSNFDLPSNLIARSSNYDLSHQEVVTRISLVENVAAGPGHISWILSMFTTIAQPLLRRAESCGFGSFYRELMPKNHVLVSSATSDEIALGGRLVLILANKALFLD